MSTSILRTKLYVPSIQPNMVSRPHLIEPLNVGLERKLTLISAPAGFGKTTLAIEWVSGVKRSVAWVSLDALDDEPVRFLLYLVSALQTINPEFGSGVSAALQSQRPPPLESLLTALINEVSTISDKFILVLDDYHVIDSKEVDDALAFLLKHQPPQMHLVILTREEPQLPLARLRVQGDLTELRVMQLRFSAEEAAVFLNQMMGPGLSAEDVAELESRTEGWIAGLKLAAISMRGRKDTTNFIKSFTGSHHFVMDYLVGEVLQQQTDVVQSFLLRTSVLGRLCGPLCEVVFGDSTRSGQALLEQLEQAGLFVIPMDNERRWYRYHHLFAELLRQRFLQSVSSSGKDGQGEISECHRRASGWYESQGLLLEAFQHAVASGDIEYTARLVEGDGMPLIYRGVLVPVVKWMASLPGTELDRRPVLWVLFASALLGVGRLEEVGHKVEAAESALEGLEEDEKVRDLIGHIASIRATLAVIRYDVDEILSQSQRALEYLHPQNLPVRTATIWSLGLAYHIQGDRVSALRSYEEAIAASEAIGHMIILIASAIGLGNIQELSNQLHEAVATYERVLSLAGEPPMPVASEAHLGLARVYYEWNELERAQKYGDSGLQLALSLEKSDRFVALELLLVRCRLALGDLEGAAVLLEKVERLTSQHHFVRCAPEIAAVQVDLLISRGEFEAAEACIEGHSLPLCEAQLHLARGQSRAALEVLELYRREVEKKGWVSEQLKARILQAIATDMHGDKERALTFLREALVMGRAGGFVRSFLEPGARAVRLLTEVSLGGMMSEYAQLLLGTEGIASVQVRSPETAVTKSPQPLVEPLSERELAVLELISEGLSNREIGERLFVALSTIKGHNQNIFGKLGVKRRTEAVARARELGLLVWNK